ncbi:MAG: hypothetical protein JWR78_979 [Mycobacterium sp.]|nr:hypothetical protein [Mycobacterium sp.]
MQRRHELCIVSIIVFMVVMVAIIDGNVASISGINLSSASMSPVRLTNFSVI